MKIFFFALFFLFIIFPSIIFALSPHVFEVGIPGLVGQGGTLDVGGSLTELIPSIINMLFGFVGLLAFAIIFYAGFQYLTAGGNTGRTKAAIDSIQGVIIGLAILFGFYAILNTINPDLLNIEAWRLDLPTTQIQGIPRRQTQNGAIAPGATIIRNGKIIVIDDPAKNFEAFFYFLPEDIRQEISSDLAGRDLTINDIKVEDNTMPWGFRAFSIRTKQGELIENIFPFTQIQREDGSLIYITDPNSLFQNVPENIRKELFEELKKQRISSNLIARSESSNVIFLRDIETNRIIAVIVQENDGAWRWNLHNISFPIIVDGISITSDDNYFNTLFPEGSAKRNEFITELRDRGFENIIIRKHFGGNRASIIDATNHEIIGTIDNHTITISYSDTPPANHEPAQQRVLATEANGELLNWWGDGGANTVFRRQMEATIIDLTTGISFTVRRVGGTNHADVEPINREQTNILYHEILNERWSWDRRPIIVEVGGRRIAASMNSMPHGSEAVEDNNGMSGHFCVHFLNSRLHKNDRIDSRHQAAIQQAAGN